MSTLDKIFIGFIMGILVAAFICGVRNHYRELEFEGLMFSSEEIILELVEERNCYKLKAQEHTIGIRRRRC